jgi:hypothetical protein
MLLFASVLAALACVAQSPSPAKNPRDLKEFPLLLHAKLIAGQAVPGATVQGKLLIATLARGTVIPAGAEFTGVVEESVAKSGTTPSRLKVHITAAKWKDETLAFDLYLTNFYYPLPGQFLTAAERMEYENNVEMRRLTHRRNPKTSTEAGYPPRVKMKNVELERGEDGAPAITSANANLHLYGGMAYCFEGVLADEKKPDAK